MSIRRLAALAALLVVTGCAHTAVPIACDCNLVRRFPIGVPAPPSDGVSASTPISSSPACPPPAILASVAAAPAPPLPSVSDLIGAAVKARNASRAGAVAASPGPLGADLLIMSGGSENGAFGAGLLDGWKAHLPAGLPRFAVVTGISTGALLTSFAFTDRTDKAIDGYTIDDERELLTPLIKSKDDYLGLLRKGAAGDLAPLRTLLDRMLDDDLLTGMAQGRTLEQRTALVGVVDVDDGQAYAYDLTEIAAHWLAQPDKRAMLKQCYIGAILASASAPPAAYPVVIASTAPGTTARRERMVIDGGARFGMFFVAADEALKAEGARRAATASPLPVTAYLIVNGDLEASTQCGEAEVGGACPGVGAHQPWNVLSLGLRSASILQNQVYRFSADYARRRAGETGSSAFRFARIEADLDSFPTKLPDLPGEASETLTCAGWLARDKDPKFGKVPLQFHKRYMRCLIAYGRARADKLGGLWW